MPDSGGAGKSRGGLGIARQIRALDDGTVFGCRSNSHLTRAEGVFGGEPGAPGRLVCNSGRAGEQNLPSKVSRLVLQAGDSMRIETPGGGGAGSSHGPQSRAPRRGCARRQGQHVNAVPPPLTAAADLLQFAGNQTVW